LEQENPYVYGKDRHVADVLSRLSIPSPDYVFTVLVSILISKPNHFWSTSAISTL